MEQCTEKLRRYIFACRSKKFTMGNYKKEEEEIILEICIIIFKIDLHHTYVVCLSVL